MKKFVLVFLILVFVISACAPTKTEVVISTTSTISPTVTHTSTPSITPLPTIPTFTPTFDVSTIVTVTPVEKAECPKQNPEIVPNFALPDLAQCIATNNMDYCVPKNTAQNILEFLNQGGSVESVISPLKQAYTYYAYQDVTGDMINDFMFVDFRTFRGFNIYVCKVGLYNLFQPNIEAGVIFQSINDINSNNIPEVILGGGNCSGSGCFGLYAFEWNGTDFINLSPSIGMFGVKDFEIKDINKDGIKEITITGDRPGSCCVGDMTPWRYKTIVYSWNGDSYMESYTTFEKANYRFQSLQDGDREVLYGNYETALNHYQDTIFDSSLEWWTEERKDYEVKLFYDSYNPITPTPLPYPLEDLSEFPSLASYAYYRILLLQLVQGQITEANQTYQTLKDTFGNDVYAKSYIEMATEFLQAYQVNQSMYDGCAAAIQYAVEHPEILIPLGSDYHGSQAKIYVPADICPFR